MSCRFHQLFAAFIAVLAIRSLSAQTPTTTPSPERGLPVLQSWTAKDFRSHHEVVYATQSIDGSMLFASLASVLEYDGHSWRKHAIPGAWVKQVVAAADGHAYVAADGEFGRLERNADGDRVYRSFAALVPTNLQPMGVVRSVVVRPEGIYFSAQSGVFRWKDGTLKTWPIEGGRQMILLEDGGDLYLANPAKGLHHFEADAWPVISVAPEILRSGRTSMTRLGDGTRLLGLYRDGLFRWDGKAAAPWPNEAAEILKTALTTDVRALPDGRVAVGTGQAGLLVLGPDGRLLEHLTQAQGLNNDTVFHVGADRDGALWLGTRNGVVRWDPALGVTRFDERLGFPEASVSALLRHQDGLFATIDGVGVFRLRPGTKPSETARFEKLPVQVGSIYGIDSHPSGLLIGTDRGLAIWDGREGRMAALSAANVKQVHVYRRDPSLVFIGTESSLHLLANRDGAWSTAAEWKLGGEPMKLAEDPAGAIWSGISSRGFARLSPPPNGGSWSAVQPRIFDQERGIGAGESLFHVLPTPLGVMFISDRGGYRHEAATDRLVREDRFTIGGARDVFFGMQSAGPDGILWGGATHIGATDMYSLEWPFGVFVPEPGGAYRWQAVPAAWSALVGQQGPFNTLAEGSGSNRVAWVSTESALLRISAAHLEARRTDFPIQLRGPYVAGKRVPSDEPVRRFGFTREPVTFRYSAPRLDLGADVRFQTRLVGFNDRWTDPTPSREASFSGLSGGPFTFEVRAIDADGRPSEVARTGFQIAAPWYRSGRALAGYGMLGLLTIQSFIRWRIGRVEARRQELEQLVDVRTRELAVARDAAEEASKAKSRFLANMSHELRTPLNGVLGFTQLLAREPELSSRNRERLRLIQSSGDHLLGLINDVLDLSKVEAGRVELRPAPFDLSALLRDLEATFAPRASQRGLQLQVAASGLPNGLLMGDAQRLRQVLENLLGNALKFTRTGSVRLEAEGGATANGGAPARVRFAVVDTGAGMSAEDVARLFQPFSQAVTGRPPEPGAGLGLAISQHLVSLMGGRIEVESQPGAGSRFEFTLPLDALSGNGGVSDASARRRITGYAGPRRRVMLVDDVEANRQLLREFLEPVGFEISEFGSGETALETFGGTSPVPDLVILDLRMPGMDGFELTRRIRALGLTPAPRIIATSASVYSFSKADAVKYGCDDFLPKPFKESELFGQVQSQLGIEWVWAEGVGMSEADASQPTAAPTPETLVPTRALEALLEAANRGDVQEVRRQLRALRQQQPGGGGILVELERLAEGYQMAALRSRLETTLASMKA